MVDQQRRLLAMRRRLRQDAAGGARRAPAARGTGCTRLLRPLWALLLERPPEEFDDAIPEDLLFGGKEVERALVRRARARAGGPTPDGRAVMLGAAHPIWVGDRVIGAVVAEETTDIVLTLRNRAFEQLLAVTLAVFVRGAGRCSCSRRGCRGGCGGCATRPSTRSTRRAACGAACRASSARDEIGDLSRSFSTVLDRLAQYNDYLEQLADRLSHELRTPIAVVRSSLDNLRTRDDPAGARRLHRPRRGGPAPPERRSSRA